MRDVSGMKTIISIMGKVREGMECGLKKKNDDKVLGSKESKSSC